MGFAPDEVAVTRGGERMCIEVVDGSPSPHAIGHPDGAELGSAYGLLRDHASSYGISSPWGGRRSAWFELPCRPGLPAASSA